MTEAVRDPISIAQDESQSVDRLMADHLDSTFRLAVSILGDADDARDATQEAFIAAWRELPKLRDPAKASAWLSRITVNAAISRLRKRARDRTANDALGRSATSTARDDDRIADRESLRAALWQLKPEYRIVLYLRFYEDLTVEQIARRIGVREGTVKSRLHYGIERLRDAFEGDQEQRR